MLLLELLCPVKPLPTGQRESLASGCPFAALRCLGHEKAPGRAPVVKGMAGGLGYRKRLTAPTGRMGRPGGGSSRPLACFGGAGARKDGEQTDGAIAGVLFLLPPPGGAGDEMPAVAALVSVLRSERGAAAAGAVAPLKDGQAGIPKCGTPGV